MAKPLRVLIIEDQPADAELVAAELRRQGFEPDWTRVETEDELRAELDSGWDVILSDFTLPSFNAIQAIRLVRQTGLDVPVIVVTGAVGEDTAAACIREGADDYLLKDRLARLGLAVSEALRRRRLERERHQIEGELLESQAELTTIFESAPLPMFVVDQRLRVVRANQEAAALAGLTATDAFGRFVAELLGCRHMPAGAADTAGEEEEEDCADCRFRQVILDTLTSGEARAGVECELELQSVRGGELSTWLVSTSPLVTPSSGLVVVAMSDITERKAAEARTHDLNQLLDTIREIDQIIVRENRPEWLLAETCRTLVEVGGFATAWVAEADHETGTFRPLAVAGDDNGLPVPKDVDPEVKLGEDHPMRMALHDRRAVVVDEPATGSSTDSIAATSVMRNCGPAAFFPVFVNERPLGVLGVCDSRPDALNAEIVSLLEELAGDVGFAIGAREEARERYRAEAALKESEKKYRQLFEAESDAILLIDNASGRILEANSVAETLYGYTREELLELRNTDLSAEPKETRRITIETPLDAETVIEVHNRLHKRKDGTVVPVEITGRFFEQEGRGVHIAAVRDVSDRHRAEAALRRDLELRTALTTTAQEIMKGAFDVTTVAELVLEHARALTASRYGFVSEVDPNDERTLGRTIFEVREATSAAAQNNASEDSSPRSGVDGPGPGPWDEAIDTRRPVMASGESTRALAVPVLVESDLLALIGLADSEREYNADDVDALNRLADLFGLAIVRARAAQALRESEERYRLLFEGSPVGIFRTTPDGRILAANPALVRMLGFSSFSELSQKNLNRYGFLDADDRTRFIREIEREGEIFGRETAMYRRDGEIVHLRESARAILSPDGEVQFYEGTLEDITAHRRAEAERDMAFELAVDLFCIATFDGYFKQLNPAWESTLGWTLDELKARSFLDLVHPDDRKATEEALSVQESGEKVLGFENRYRCKDGTYRWLSWNSSPLPEQGLVFATARDITRAKELEEQLRHAQKMEAVGRLAGGVAHDFNNLLQAMLAQTQVIRVFSSDATRVATAADELERHVQRGAALTRQLLLFSRKETEQRESLDLNTLIEGQTTLLRRLVPENIGLELEFGTEPLFVIADKGQLEQVLMNLVVNAADALEGGGNVAIRAGRHDEDRVYLAVEDDGPGIPEEIRSRVFEPFFTTKPAEKGTGLGLSVVHGIVSQHGGTIDIEDRDGGGTVFRILLSETEPAEGAPSREDSSGSSLAVGDGEHVLVVEDEPAAREGLVAILEGLGYVPTAVESGEAVADLIDPPPFDVLITDLMLPGMSGDELAREIRTRWPRIAVVLMSGYAQNETLRQDIGEGSVHFLQKPFDMTKLAAAIRKALDGIDS